MKKDRVMLRLSTGEMFIETPAPRWRSRLKKWRERCPAFPCPLPAGHRMFKKPEDYGCVRYL